MRVGVYTRLSEDRTGQQTATARQEAACRDYARSRGWEVAAVYSDVDLSAYRRGVTRPDFERLIADVETGLMIDGVLCWKLDRLVRNHADFERLWTACESRSALLASATEPVDSSSEIGMIVVRLLVSFARLESANISIRTKAAHKAAAQRGRPHPSGQRAYGLTRDWTAIVDEEAAHLQEAASRVLSGEPVHRIAQDYNRRGIGTVTGKPWRPSILARVLRAPHLAGLRVYDGEVIGRGDWPAVFDEDTHHRLVAVLGDASRQRGGGGQARYLLSGGLLRCGLCGSAMVSRPREDKVRRYVCKREPGLSSCGKVGILAEPTEELVTEVVFAALDSPEFVEALTTDSDDHAGLLDQLRADEEQLEQLARDHYRDRLIGRSEYLAARQGLAERIEATRRALGRRRDGGVLAAVGAGQEALREAWGAKSVEWRRRLLKLVLEAVVIGPAVRGRGRYDPDRVAFKWKA